MGSKQGHSGLLRHMEEPFKLGIVALQPAQQNIPAAFRMEINIGQIWSTKKLGMGKCSLASWSSHPTRAVKMRCALKPPLCNGGENTGLRACPVPWDFLVPASSKKISSCSFPTVLVHSQHHVVLGMKTGQLVLARANLGAEIPFSQRSTSYPLNLDMFLHLEFPSANLSHINTR